ncbi:hypothetical protein KP509_07G066800 [Ceratopteris richardii]|uniref:Haloacid dehalogenase-like hydrolase domain-containing protein n=1 Tax=Ceratopteris richardii TaxID=49495 RepID=A0A8T2UAT5_CERRI|nr:hypothetical protein KP509_07G066800 [Ceratopteris richardii]KAH7433382.1 hypothetical protein KP509_07G066800 [Ceratopteris richardii]
MASLTRAAAPSTAVASTMRTLRGVIFDMDGTLTVPVIDFAKMYREVLGPNHPRIVAGSPIDILHEIQEWPTDKQRVAYQVITRHEQEAHERLQIMPGAVGLCSFLDSRKLRRGLITRNVKASVDLFHQRFGISEFFPALSREFTPYKPHPAPFLHICKVWDASPAHVMMVGDSAKDDMVCGNRAGAITCLLDPSGKYDLDKLLPEEQPDYKVKSLQEVQDVLESYFDLRP